MGAGYNSVIIESSFAAAAAAAIATADAAIVVDTIDTTDHDVATDENCNKDDATPVTCALATIDDDAT